MARLRLTLILNTGARVGPGKAALLESIRDTGSISAAARAMGMSYKRAWLLLDSLNAAFEPVVVTTTMGGAGGGGRGSPTSATSSSSATGAWRSRRKPCSARIWRACSMSLGLMRGRRSDRALAMGLGIAIGYS